MSSTMAINLYSIMSATISPVTSSTTTLSKVIILKAFIKNKNLILKTFGLAINSDITADNTQII